MRFAAPLSIVLALASSAAGQGLPPQPADDAHRAAYITALQSLARGQTDRAIESLRAIVARPTASPSRNGAAVVLDQLDGGAAERLARFHRLAHADTVVLVPDERSLLSALDRWTDQAIFPVLIDDGWLAPIFVAAYQPKQVVRWADPDKQREPTPARIAKLATQHNGAIRRAMAAGHVAPGLVAIDPNDAPAIAGVALAKAYGQPIALVPCDQRVMANIGPEQINPLAGAMLKALVESGVGRPDRWCALTLAGDYPVRCHFGKDPKPLYCLDDVLGRAPDGTRVAVCGRLTGDVAMSNYQAMASMFLVARRALLADSYASDKLAYQAYRLAGAARDLAGRFDVRQLSGASLTPAAFRRATAGASPPDFVWVNSAGMATQFQLATEATSSDVPVGQAQAVYMVHSFSAQTIWSADTIAGRWLAGGAYWYFGSMHEPYLHAFTPTATMTARALAGTPVAFAARQMPGTPMAKAWRLLVIGNPLWSWRDRPAERHAGVPLQGAAPIALPNGAGAIDRLVHARLTGEKVDAALLDDAAGELADAPNDRLVRAVYEMARADRRDLLLAIDDAVAARHAIARRYVGDAVADEFARHVGRGQLDAATPLVGRLAVLSGGDRSTARALEAWLNRMTVAGRGMEARRHLQRVLDTAKLHPRTKRAITGLLQPGPPKPGKTRP